MLADACLTGLSEHWEESSAGFNEGQYVIYDWYLLGSLYEWMEEAYEVWPGADADWYVELMFSSYDFDVTERAFSDTIWAPTERMWEIIYKAQDLQEKIYMLEAMIV